MLSYTHPQRRRGLTLVELLAVVVILGLLAGSLAVGFSGAFARGKHELAKTGIGIIVQKVETYKIEHGAWPEAELGLAALGEPSASPTAAYYLSANQLLDPWDRPYAIIIPGPGKHPYEVVTYGADGQPGGAGENADLSSIDLRKDGTQ